MAYQNSVSPLLLVKCSHYSLVAVQPFKVGLQLQTSVQDQQQIIQQFFP